MKDKTRVPIDSLRALELLKGEEHQDWVESVVDEVEWTDPHYWHQN